MRYLPTSIFQLTLMGFALVSLPLIVALVVTVYQVDHLSQRSLKAVFDSANSVQNSRRLVELATAMERSASQYQVLGDPTLYHLYLDKHNEFERVSNAISKVGINPALQSRLDELNKHEKDLYGRIVQTRDNLEEIKPILQEFPELSSLARPLLIDISKRIADAANAMHDQADRIKHQLLLMFTALIPLALILAGIFTVLITRPLRQINEAIRRMGSDGFTDSIEVDGPMDIRELGEHLEWLRRHLADLENQKVNFLRQISHDLKTPLTAIREGSELLSERVLGNLNTKQIEVAQILKDNSVRLQDLIENLLHFNVAQSPASQINIKATSIEATIRKVIQDHELALRSANLELQLSLRPAQVISDPDQLRMIFDNLLSNAIKYSPQNGRITIGMTEADNNALIDIVDEGPGIDPMEQKHIFSAYFQGTASHSGRVKGTGLGLAIAKEFVSLINGRIEILQGTQKGAHFRVILPADANDNA